MRYSALSSALPGPLRRHILHFEAAIDRAVSEFARGLPEGVRLLDAGSGEGQYRKHFQRQRYFGVDLGVGDTTWDYSKLDALADLTALPFPAATFDACIHVVTIEHLREPKAVLAEIGRALKPGGHLLVVAPLEWEVHQSPHDYFRYTRHGLEYLLRAAGFGSLRIEPVGGYFRLLARRMLNGLQFFSGGLRWIWFLPAAAALVPPALLLPLLDPLDRDRNFTLGYICTATKSS